MNTDNVAVITYRGASKENSHRAHVSVVDDTGELLYYFGDPRRFTLARSAAKPIQALAIMETGAIEEFGLNDRDIALMCASHSSEDVHIDQARMMLAKISAQESDLHCGGHAPISDVVNKTWIKADFTPTAICSNCSGKHVGMLAGSKAIKADIKGYCLPSHPMQTAVRRSTASVCEMQLDQIEWAVDGCNLPTPAFPLDRLALTYAKLASGADIPNTDDRRISNLGRIYHAMVSYPHLVAGTGRYCTKLMEVFEGSLVGKLGADACYGIGVRSSEHTRRLGAKGAIGISVKVEDGNIDVLYMVVTEILHQLEIGTEQQRRTLDSFHRPDMLNTMGNQVGHIEFPIILKYAN